MPFGVLMIAVAIWSLTLALSVVQDSDGAVIFWTKASYLGSAMLPAAWLAMASQYTGRGSWLRPHVLAMLAIEPAVMVLLVWTNSLHHVVWGAVSVHRTGSIPVLAVEAGPLPIMHTVYGYLLVAIGLVLFARAFKQAHQLYQYQALSVVVAVLGPAGANLLLVVNIWPWDFDPTPFAASVGGVALVWGLFRVRLFDVIPLAREAVIEGMLDGVVVLDQRGRIVDVNPAASAIVGLSAIALVGHDEAEAVAALRARQDPGSEAPAGGQIGVLIDGDRRFFELRSQSLYDASGAPTGRLLVINDVTATRSAERALIDAMERLDQMVAERTAELEQANERLAVTMRSMGDGVIVVDGDGNVALMNEVAMGLADSTADEVLGRPVAEVLPALQGVSLWGGAGGAHFSMLPQDVDLGDGTGRTLQALATPILEGPEAGGAVLLIRDVTDERASQRQLEQEGRLAALGQMAAGIAHDFNNFLTGVVTSADTLRKLPDTPQRSLSILERIGESGRRTAQLVRQVLEFSRESVAPRETIDLSELLAGMADMVRSMVPESVTLTFSVEPRSCAVKGNPAQLQQVLTNLVSNAADASGGDGRIDVHLGVTTVEDRAGGPLPDMEPGDWATLSVSDNGVGISPAVVGHIFDPFFTTKEPGKGTGLGLAQVYGVIKQHRGRIGATSQLGVGTTITAYLPLSIEAISVRSALPIDDLPRGKGETILLVEDDELVVEALSIALEYLGYRVLKASNGNEGLERYRSDPKEIDLVLTDITMPGLGGIELFHRLKESDPEVRVIAMTGYALDDDAREHLAEGVLEWLEKPPSLPLLAAALRQALDASVRSAP